jgi:hypothetical protein
MPAGNITKIEADAEVPIEESKVVPFNFDVNVYGHLLYPGCHFVFYDKTDQVVNQIGANDAPLKVCFGASTEMQMGIFYYTDTPVNGRAWAYLPAHLEDNGRLVCADAVYTGVYMPTGLVVPPPGTGQAGENTFFPNGWGGTVLPPPPSITITGSGTYAVGGICLLTTKYFVTGLSDTIQVEYPRDAKNHYTEDTKTVPFSDYVNGELFYFPGCHVIHYLDENINNVMTPTIQKEMTVQQGAWQICFAAIPGKTMTIYYYQDDTVTPVPTTAPLVKWTSLKTITANGMACADLDYFSAVYAPAGK